jgi:hypothetical protein
MRAASCLASPEEKGDIFINVYGKPKVDAVPNSTATGVCETS